MISLARKNALKARTSNVTFIQSRINDLPLPPNSVDCVISNCVLNLVPEADKASVFSAIHRVLKPGGRLAVSDFLAYKPLPQAIKDDPALQVGCVSGSSTEPKMRELLGSAGFVDMLLVDTNKDLNLYKDGEQAVSVTPCCSGETSCGPMRASPSGRKELDYDLNEWIGMPKKNFFPNPLCHINPPSLPQKFLTYETKKRRFPDLRAQDPNSDSRFRKAQVFTGRRFMHPERRHQGSSRDLKLL